MKKKKYLILSVLLVLILLIFKSKSEQGIGVNTFNRLVVKLQENMTEKSIKGYDNNYLKSPELNDIFKNNPTDKLVVYLNTEKSDSTIHSFLNRIETCCESTEDIVILTNFTDTTECASFYSRHNTFFSNILNMKGWALTGYQENGKFVFTMNSNNQIFNAFNQENTTLEEYCRDFITNNYDKPIILQ